MLKTHKIALDPNNVQATQFAQHCGYARVAYNHVLADFKEGLDNGEWHNHIELVKRNSVMQYEWCKALNCCSLRFTLTSKMRSVEIRAKQVSEV